MIGGITIEKEDLDRVFLNFCLEEARQQKLSQELHKKKVIVLAGPTGCGKSALGLLLAKAMGGEIISSDSMQVYRGMDIGTAKATKEERKQVPHHLIDIRDVKEGFNVVDFYYEAKRCCQIIHDRGAVPIVVGGAGFYIHTLLYGPPVGPPSVPELRKSLEEEMTKLGSERLYEKLLQLDPEYASSITCNDKQKIVRALEIITLTGKKVSLLSWKSRKNLLNYDFRCWFLHRPRETLYQRIEKRCERMLLDGLLDEVAVLEKEGIRSNSSASQAIGYRQSLDFLNTKQTRDDYYHFVQVFKKASRNYAKRQFTWFRQKPFPWLDLDLHDPETAVDMIMQDYEYRK